MKTRKSSPIEVIIQHTSEFNVSGILEEVVRDFIFSRAGEPLNIVWVHDTDERSPATGLARYDDNLPEEVNKLYVGVAESLDKIKNPKDILKRVRRILDTGQVSILDNVDAIVFEKPLSDSALQSLTIDCKLNCISVIAAKQTTPW